MWGKKELTKADNPLENLNLICGSNTMNIGELKARLDAITKEFDAYREDVNLRFKKLGILLNEKLEANKDDLELTLIGISKSFDSKINVLSDGKPLVTDLLRQIARLEGVRDASEHRRTTEEILSEIARLDDLVKTAEVSDRTDKVSQEHLNALRWALGENQ